MSAIAATQVSIGLAISGFGGPHATFADVGVTYLLNKASQLDFRVGSGLNQGRDDWFVGAGISTRF